MTPAMPDIEPNSTQWQPGEPTADIQTDQYMLQGAFVVAIAYGATALLSVQCCCMLVRSFERATLARRNLLLLLAFVVLIFSLNTAYVSIIVHITQSAFVENRNFPGGPAAYEQSNDLRSTVLAGDSCIIIVTMLADALLLWRCTIIYNSTLVPRWLTLSSATLMWFAEFVLGTLLLAALASASVLDTANLVLIFWSFSLARNVLATALICGRLIFFRYQLRKAFGSECTSQYTSIIAMVVESEALYSIYLIMFIVPVILKQSLAQAFVQAPACVQSVTALLIVYRVAVGKAWCGDTHEVVTTRRAVSTIRFSSAPPRFAAQSAGRFENEFVMGAEKSEYALQDVGTSVRSEGDSQ